MSLQPKCRTVGVDLLGVRSKAGAELLKAIGLVCQTPVPSDGVSFVSTSQLLGVRSKAGAGLLKAIGLVCQTPVPSDGVSFASISQRCALAV